MGDRLYRVVNTLQSVEERVGIGEKQDNAPIDKIHAVLIPAEQPIEEVSQRTDVDDDGDGDDGQNETSSDIAGIVPALGNTLEVDGEEGPEHGDAAEQPIFKKDDDAEAEDHGGGVAWKGVEARPTLRPVRVDALQMQGGIEEGPDVRVEVSLNPDGGNRAETGGKKTGHHAAATLDISAGKPQCGKWEKNRESAEEEVIPDKVHDLDGRAVVGGKRIEVEQDTEIQTWGHRNFFSTSRVRGILGGLTEL